MEMMVIILFFSLSVMIIFRLFVSAHLNDQDSTRLNNALLEAKNTVELFKANGTDIFGSGDWIFEETEPGVYRYVKNSPEDCVITSAYILIVALTIETAPLGVYESGEVRAYINADGMPEGDPFLALQIGYYRQTAEDGVR